MNVNITERESYLIIDYLVQFNKVIITEVPSTEGLITPKLKCQLKFSCGVCYYAPSYTEELGQSGKLALGLTRPIYAGYFLAAYIT